MGIDSIPRDSLIWEEFYKSFYQIRGKNLASIWKDIQATLLDYQYHIAWTYINKDKYPDFNLL
jgi:hypothetical protein